MKTNGIIDMKKIELNREDTLYLCDFFQKSYHFIKSSASISLKTKNRKLKALKKLDNHFRHIEIAGKVVLYIDELKGGSYGKK